MNLRDVEQGELSRLMYIQVASSMESLLKENKQEEHMGLSRHAERTKGLEGFISGWVSSASTSGFRLRSGEQPGEEESWKIH
jgi:hypothetical protein